MSMRTQKLAKDCRKAVLACADNYNKAGAAGILAYHRAYARLVKAVKEAKRK